MDFTACAARSPLRGHATNRRFRGGPGPFSSAPPPSAPRHAPPPYNCPAAGPAGGADLGMNRQFWGYATRGLLEWINQHAPAHAPIYWHDTNQAQLNMYVREGDLRADIRNTPLEEPG